MISILIFIIILSVLVMIHEFGHFIMAKRAGIGVEEFGFGLPPRLWGKKIKGTIYSINWLPFGGFVRLVGEDPTDKNANGTNSFGQKPILTRATVIVAGVFMNLMLAAVIYYYFVISSGFSLPFEKLPFDYTFKGVSQISRVVVAGVSADSPAFKAGIKGEEAILSVDGTDVKNINDLQTIVRRSENRRIAVVLENVKEHKTRTVEVVPEMNKEVNAPAIGVSLAEMSYLNFNTLTQKVFSGFIFSYNMIVFSFGALGKLIGSAISSGNVQPVANAVSGPIGIAHLTMKLISFNDPMPVVIASILNLMAMFSLNLAVLNILPIPALDGGRFAFLIYEAISRKKPNASVEKWIHTIGFVSLISLIVLISYNDILKIIHNQLPF